MSDYRYILDKSSRKFVCPECGKRRLVKYIDSKTQEYLPEIYGRCDRKVSCGYHLNPYRDGYGKDERREWERKVKPKNKPLVYFPYEWLERTFKGYEKNTFIQNLLRGIPFPIPKKDILEVIELYYLGTLSKGYLEGAITFPFIDKSGNVRTVQVKQFDDRNHTTKTSFLHSILKSYYGEDWPDWLSAYLENEKYVSCLFGEHLLAKYQHNTIALVEAPKTAIYGTLYFGSPIHSNNYLWLAVYNLSSLTVEKCKSLKGRRVILFPDLSKDGTAFKRWEYQADRLNQEIQGASFKVSDFLEKHATNEDREKGCDLADFLIRFDPIQFSPRGINPQINQAKAIIPQIESPITRADLFKAMKQKNPTLERLQLLFGAELLGPQRAILNN